MDIIKSIAYMRLWAVGFIAVDALVHPFYGQVQNFIAGTHNGGN